MRMYSMLLALLSMLLSHVISANARSIFKPKGTTDREKDIVAALLMMMSTDVDFLDRVIIAVSKHFIGQTRSTGGTVFKRLILQGGGGKASRNAIVHAVTRYIFGSSGSRKYRRKWVHASMTNMCYALGNDTPYILEHEPYFIPHGLPHHTAKIIGLQKYLTQSEVILWLDLDTVILDASAQLFRIPETYLNSDVILVDHSKTINNGVFFLRKSAWSFEFLVETIAILSAIPNMKFFDNGAFYYAMMNNFRRLNLYPHCDTISMDHNRPDYSLNEYFACANLTYNNRVQVGRFAFLSSEEYRLNMWYLPSYFDWDIRDTHREGDTIVHTKKMNRFVNASNVASKCLNVKDYVWINLLAENRVIYEEVLRTMRKPPANAPKHTRQR